MENDIQNEEYTKNQYRGWEILVCQNLKERDKLGDLSVSSNYYQINLPQLAKIKRRYMFITLKLYIIIQMGNASEFWWVSSIINI